MRLDWGGLQSVTGVLSNVALLLGAAAAVVKFRLFNILGHRWQTSLQCGHVDLPDRTVIFTADDTISNTGQRPLLLRAVSLRLVHAREEGNLLVPDEDAVIASRIVRPGERGQRGNLQVEPGERTIFTLRIHLERLPDCVFVLCAIDPATRRPYTTYRGFYCRFPRANAQAPVGGAVAAPSSAAPAAG